MAQQYSDKIITIIENINLYESVEIALGRHNLNVVKSNMNLFSTSIIRQQVTRTNDITIIGSEFIKYVQEQGLPFAIIMDGRINCGFGAEKDPDGLILFKTLLLLNMTLSRKKTYEHFRASFLLLVSDEDEARLKNLIVNPKTLLSSLQSSDNSTKMIINEYIKDVFKFGTRFYIECARALPGSEIATSIDRFIVEIKNRTNLTRLKTEGATMDTSSTEPASIVYKSEDGLVIVDSKPYNSGLEEFGELKSGELYVIGNWTNRTQMEVSRKLAKAINRGVPDVKIFEKDEKVIVNFDNRTRVDASTAASLAGILAKDLSDYKNIQILVNKENGFIMKNSPGFGLVKKQIRFTQ